MRTTRVDPVAAEAAYLYGSLTRREWLILSLRSGREDGRRWTIREIAFGLGCSVQAVRVLLQRGIEKVEAQQQWRNLISSTPTRA